MTPPPSGSSPPIDPAVVAALKELGGEDDPGLFAELVDTFLADTPARLDAIEQSAKNKDGQGLMKSAHGLKSSAANMGAVLLAELCRQLEAAGHGGTLDGVESMIVEARRQFDSAQRALMAERS